MGQIGGSPGYTISYALKQNPQSRTLGKTALHPAVVPERGYEVQENIRDIWTPNGQLTLWGTYPLHISGSVYDDWGANEVTNQ